MDQLEYLPNLEAGERGSQSASHLLPALISQREQALGHDAGLVGSVANSLAVIGEGIEALDAHLADELRIGKVVQRIAQVVDSVDLVLLQTQVLINAKEKKELTKIQHSLP